MFVLKRMRKAGDLYISIEQCPSNSYLRIRTVMRTTTCSLVARHLLTSAAYLFMGIIASSR